MGRSKKRQKKAAEGEGTSTSKPPAPNLPPPAKDAQQPPPKTDPKSKGKGKEKVDQETKTPKPYDRAKCQIRKLVPPRPFPTVPLSVSATGPRSAHREGKNQICITRRTPLGGYLRRCKELILKDGYKTLHLYALGAAIPHLLRLVTSLPTILPYASEEYTTQVTTGTVEVQDEVIPDDEDEDTFVHTRNKASLRIVFKVSGGDPEPIVDEEPAKKKKRKKKRKGKGEGDGDTSMQPVEIIADEPDQEPLDMEF